MLNPTNRYINQPLNQKIFNDKKCATNLSLTWKVCQFYARYAFGIRNIQLRVRAGVLNQLAAPCPATCPDISGRLSCRCNPREKRSVLRLLLRKLAPVRARELPRAILIGRLCDTVRLEARGGECAQVSAYSSRAVFPWRTATAACSARAQVGLQAPPEGLLAKPFSL